MQAVVAEEGIRIRQDPLYLLQQILPQPAAKGPNDCSELGSALRPQQELRQDLWSR